MNLVPSKGPANLSLLPEIGLWMIIPLCDGVSLAAIKTTIASLGWKGARSRFGPPQKR
jgi:hypothetical protein